MDDIEKVFKALIDPELHVVVQTAPGEHPRALMYIISGKICVGAIDDSGRSKLMFICPCQKRC